MKGPCVFRGPEREIERSFIDNQEVTERDRERGRENEIERERETIRLLTCDIRARARAGRRSLGLSPSSSAVVTK
jgi:hypothetical protein